MRPVLTVLAWTLSLCACSSAARFESTTPGGVDLSGIWKLNRAASDDPAKVIAGVSEKIRGRHDRGPVQGGPVEPDDGLPGDERRGTRGPGGQERGVMRTTRRERIAPEEFLADVGTGRGMLHIKQSPTEVVIDNGSRTRKLTPGGSSVVSMSNGVADQHSGWSGGAFVIEIRGRDRPTIVERYALSPDRRQLLVDVKIDGNGHMPNISMKRVYDASSDSGPASGPST